MSEGDPEIARAAIFEIIENQIEAGTPPETQRTLKRLMAEGRSEEEAMKLIGCVVTTVIFGMLKEGKAYDEAAYIKALLALPRLPWE
ncbi:hypothetical protein [Solimonas terrae]|uniref:Uncharacterized protein n=1 Tax=Solimonas terrae TaxID=1396819 RepID=A0A6M2BXQ5_9GAMM|nr:hypothetical protein [Solimonas terrae]NGY06617.1 hypothetical protein [Solimonas terrae]